MLALRAESRQADVVIGLQALPLGRFSATCKAAGLHSAANVRSAA